MFCTYKLRYVIMDKFPRRSNVRFLGRIHHAGGGGGNSEGHVGVGKREVRGGEERGVGGGARRAGRRG